MATLLPIVQQYFGNDGRPLAGGLVYTYEPSTLTPKLTYANEAGTQPLSNPIELDAYGRCNTETGIWGSGFYRVIVATAEDVPITDTDYVSMGPDIVPSGNVNPSDNPIEPDLNMLDNTVPTFFPLLEVDGTTIGDVNDTDNVAQFWNVLTQSGKVTASRDDAPTLIPVTSALILEQSYSAAQRFGVINWASSLVSMPRQERKLQLSIQAKPSYPMDVNIAAVCWSGTADEYPADVVNNWTSSDYSSGGFFINSVTPMDSTLATTCPANTWTRVSTEVEVPSTVSNIALFVWTKDAVPITATLELTMMDMYEGETLRGWRPVDLGIVYSQMVANNPTKDMQSLLYNSDFRLFQRTDPNTATAVSDDNYGPDRWNILTETASVQIQRDLSTDTGSSSLYTCLITQNQAGAQHFGIEQILPLTDSFPLRGKQICVKGRIKTSVFQPIRMAVLEWTGTPDTVTSDVVNDWTSTDYTAGNFFIGSNLTVNKVVSVENSAGSWGDIEIKGIEVGTSCANLIIFVWVQDDADQNYTLELTSMLLCRDEDSYLEKVYIPKLFEQEIQDCEFFYEKTYDIDVAPGTANATESMYGWQAITTTPGSWHPFRFRQRKRVIPTINLYSPVTGTIGMVRDFFASSDLTSTVDSAYLGCSGFTRVARTAGNYSATDTFGFHIIADAEL
jgi:hypothetical protein